MSSSRFSAFVEKVLRDSGWFPGRNVGDLVLRWQQELTRTDGLGIFPEAERVLSEFGGLVIDQAGPGLTSARESFQILPVLAVYEGDRFAEYAALLKADLYPLGEASAGHYFLVIGEDGRVFLVMDDVQLVGANFDEALEHLILGVEPKIVEKN